MNPKLSDILTKLRSELQALYGGRLAQMWLFGSQSRGDANKESDIDVLVVLEKAVRPGEEIARTGPAIARLSLEHGIVISCVFVSRDRYLKEKSPLLLNIHREGIEV